MNKLTRPMSHYEEKLALFTQRLGVTSSELQNTLIEINWVKLIRSTEPLTSTSVKFYLPDSVGSLYLSSHRPHINLIDLMGTSQPLSATDWFKI